MKLKAYKGFLRNLRDMALKASVRRYDVLRAPPWQQWLFAVLVYAAVTGLNIRLGHSIERAVFTPYLTGLVAVGLFSGLIPGAVLLIAATLTVQTWWVEPYGTLLPVAKESDALALAMSVACGAAILFATARVRELAQFEREARKGYERALRVGKMATWRWDLDTDALTFSGGAKDVLGVDTLPKSMGDGWSMVDEQHRGAAQKAITAAVASGKAFRKVTKISAAGSSRWVEMHGRVAHWGDGKPKQVVAVMADVTERQEALIASQVAEKKLEEEARRKDTFLATLAHELRNPMAPIRYAAAMLKSDATPAQLQTAKDVISRQSAHISRLLDDLLDLSRITRNAIELRHEVLDLRGVVEAAADSVKPDAVQSKKTISFTVSDLPVYVDGDATRLQQIVGNLLDNALKYSQSGTEVHVCVTTEAKNAVIRVSDAGEGIDPASQHAVFELFTQLHPPGQGRGGLGIGLSVVKQLVQLHGGSVHVHSDGLGKGSEFTVRLPLAVQTPHQVAARAANVVQLPSAGSVLVVEDNVDAADALVACLRDAGFTASVAYTGQQALEAFGSLHPATVLLDLGLPDLHGTEVARQIRKLPSGSQALLIAVTGWGQEKDRAQTAAAGFDMHYVKPVDPVELIASLRRDAGRTPTVGGV